jgi:hypothetical protein
MALDIIKFVSSANREEISKDVFGGCFAGVFRAFFILLLRGIVQGIYLKTINIKEIITKKKWGKKSQIGIFLFQI